MIKEAIQHTVDGKDLSQDEAEGVMQELMDGSATPGQMGALLTAMRMKGETVEEILGFARVMRARATPVVHHQVAVTDTCGTGGDHSGTFNISTTAALVVAGAGVKVAKHGNRALTSKAGSFDVLNALGVKTSMPPETVGVCLDEVGIGFLFAPAHHGATKHVGPIRSEIGIRTVFNLLGPLTNPAGAQHQLVGVFDADFAEKLAEVLGRLGSKHALVVHGEDGLDEITLTGETRVAEYKGGKVRSWHLQPEEYGMHCCEAEDLKGGDAQANARITMDVLRGEGGPKRDVVILNAAAALVAADVCSTLRDGIQVAMRSIDEGLAHKTLQRWIEFSNAH